MRCRKLLHQGADGGAPNGATPAGNGGAADASIGAAVDADDGAASGRATAPGRATATGAAEYAPARAELGANPSVATGFATGEKAATCASGGTATGAATCAATDTVKGAANGKGAAKVTSKGISVASTAVGCREKPHEKRPFMELNAEAAAMGFLTAAARAVVAASVKAPHKTPCRRCRTRTRRHRHCKSKGWLHCCTGCRGRRPSGRWLDSRWVRPVWLRSKMRSRVRGDAERAA